MKRLFSAFAIMFCVAASAQDLTDAQKAALDAANAMNGAKAPKAAPVKPNYWTRSLDMGLGFNQTFLSKTWAAGGFSTVTLAASLDAKADYAKDLLSWNNRLQLNYAFMWSADKKNLLQKSNDRIYLESKFAYKTGKESKWNYTASLDVRSQFSNTYDKYVQEDPADENSWVGKDVTSTFFAPAYNNLALGMEWKPNEWFNLNIAPLTGGLTIVADSRGNLRKTYGMAPKPEYAERIAAGDPLATGDWYRSVLFQFGAQVKMNAKACINKKLNLETQLVLFTDYLDNPFTHTRINWDNNITWQLTKFFRLGFNTWLIYDPKVTIDGVQSKVQFKEFLSISFNWTIASKK